MFPCSHFHDNVIIKIEGFEVCVYTADLQLDVKGCRDVYASFDKYVEVERLEGDNKYQAEAHGLQVSKHVCRYP